MKTTLNQINAFIGTVLFISAISTGNCTATNIYRVTDNELISKSTSFLNPITLGSSINDDLDKAKKEGKVVFLIITGNGALNVDKAISLAKEAKGKVKNTTYMQLNRDDASNNTIVSKFRIQAVPIPFILVLSAKGLPVAGVDPAKATSVDLVKSIPSPCQDAVFFVLNDKKPVFLIIHKKEYKDKNTVIANCKSAIAKITSKPEIVEIDFDDKKETEFLKLMGVTSLNGQTTTIIINTAGQVTDKLIGIQSIDKLVSAVNKAPSKGGCCPGGSGKPGCK